MSEPQLKWVKVPPGGSADVYACKCGLIIGYVAPRSTVSCFDCGRLMTQIKNVVVTAPQRSDKKLSIVPGMGDSKERMR